MKTIPRTLSCHCTELNVEVEKLERKGGGGCVCVCETRQEAKKMQRRRLGERRVQKMSQQSWDKVQRKGNLKEEGEKDSARGK